MKYQDKMKKNDSWLPIGTIVTLKGYEKKVMIYGRTQSSDGQYYDYVACPYPRGNISTHYNVFFNKSDIHKIIFLGYIDADEKMLALRL